MKHRLIFIMLTSIMLLGLACANPAQEHLEQGDAYFGQQNLDEAILEYGKAIELDPDLALAYSHRGWTYAAKGELDTDRILQALEMSPPLSVTMAESVQYLRARANGRCVAVD